MRYLTFLFLLFSVYCLPIDALVTFIVPCHNQQNLIEKSIDSIFRQKIKEGFEVICVDDASDDGSYSLLLKLRQKYPLLQVYRHSATLGLGACCNTCVKNSSGDLLFRVNPGDVLADNTAQKLVDTFDQGDHQFVCVEKLLFKNPLDPPISFSNKRGFFRMKDILRSYTSPIWLNSYLFSRYSFESVGGYKTDYEGLDSFIFLFLQMEKGLTIGYAPKTSMTMENSPFSISLDDPRCLSFYNFMIEYEHIFSMSSIWHAEKELRSIEHRGVPENHISWYFNEQKLKLR